MFAVTEHRRALQFPLSSLLAPASFLHVSFLLFNHLTLLCTFCVFTPPPPTCATVEAHYFTLSSVLARTRTQHFLLAHSLPHVLLSSSSPASSAGRLTAVCIHSCTCVTHWSATGRWAWGGGGHLRIVFPLSYCNLCYKARGVA